MAIHGGCACGAVRYVLARDELPPVYCCHCRDCQSRSGSVCTETAIIGPDELQVTGAVAVKTGQMPSGATIETKTCGECGGWICSVTGNFPGKALLRAGTLDDSDRVVPVAHLWTSRKQPWVGLPDGVPQWEEAPSAEFLELLGLA